MRAVAIGVVAAAMCLASATPARACDPYLDWWCDWYDPYWDLPAYEEPTVWWWETEPVYYAPAPMWSDPIVWTAPETDMLPAWTAPEPAPAPVAYVDPIAAAPAGAHVVTDVWTGHVVVSDGPLTTYTSTTATADAGTVARLIATVATGETTLYDAAVLGGRMSLDDGRAVAGDIYENYVWNGYEWVVNAYVFFQDDAEIARLAQGTAVPTLAPSPASVTSAPIGAMPPATPSPAYVAPRVEEAPSAVSEAPPASSIPSVPPVARVVRVGIALAPQADALSRVEVLRGRRVSLWPRATVDGVPATVLRWHVLSGELTALGATSGEGDEPLVAMWQDVSRAGVAFPASMRVTVEVPGEAPRELDASIEVVVLAPAVVE